MAEERFERDPDGARELRRRGARRGEARARRAARPRPRDPPGAARRARARRGDPRVRRALAAAGGGDRRARRPRARPVESAAYFVVAEALTNVAKHSRRDARDGATVAPRRRPPGVRSPTTAQGGADPVGQRPDGPAHAGRGARRRRCASRARPAARRSCARSCRAGRDRRGPRAAARRAHAPARAESGFEVVAAVEDGAGLCSPRSRSTSPTSASSTSGCRRRSPTRACGRRSRRAARVPGLPVLVLSPVRRAHVRGGAALRRRAAASATCSRTASPTSREFVDAVRARGRGRHGARSRGRGPAAGRARRRTAASTS